MSSSSSSKETKRASKRSSQSPGRKVTKRTTTDSYLPTFKSVAFDSLEPSVNISNSPLRHASELAGLLKTSSDNNHTNAALLSLPTNNKDNNNMDNNTIPSSSSCVWNVSVKPVPNYYCLEQHSCTTLQEDCNVIAQRIVKANREMSVFAKYDDEKASASLITPDHIEIHIQLFASSNTNTNNNNNNNNNQDGGVILEIQRQCGDSVSFHRYSRCLKQAASTGDYDAMNNNNIMMMDDSPPVGMNTNTVIHDPINNTMPDYDYYNDDNDNDDTTLFPHSNNVREEHAQQALNISSHLLRDNKLDAQTLGMESLTILTDITKTGLTAALLASRAVLNRDSHDDNNNDSSLHDAIFQILLESNTTTTNNNNNNNNNNNDNNNDNDENSNTHIDTALREHHSLMRHRTLLILANAIHVLTTHGSPMESNHIYEMLQGNHHNDNNNNNNNDVLPQLLCILEEHPTRPHDAVLCAKFLNTLIKSNPTKTRQHLNSINSPNLQFLLHKANDYGNKMHKDLAKECCELLTLV